MTYRGSYDTESYGNYLAYPGTTERSTYSGATTERTGYAGTTTERTTGYAGTMTERTGYPGTTERSTYSGPTIERTGYSGSNATERAIAPRQIQIQNVSLSKIVFILKKNKLPLVHCLRESLT